MTNIRKLPIGIQDFEDLRTNGYLYVDKTEYIYKLLEGKPYFLARPRRFGKSLFTTTLKAYFLGKKELFEGLAIAEKEKEWIEYPVFHFVFNAEIYDTQNSLREFINLELSNLEKVWEKDESERTLSSRFRGLIRRAYEKTGRKVVILIDEYDKPLLDTVDNPKHNEQFRKILKGFYGVLKAADEHLRFVFLTGVTKFSKVSIFSDLNHLIDISMADDCAGICGISEPELIWNFDPEINALAQKINKNYEQTLAELKKHYNGYHFSRTGEGMYNPFSLLNTFRFEQFRKYWFETGTPTFLAKMLKDIAFDIKSLENDVQITEDSIMDYRVESSNLVPLLYQAGYLTIKEYNQEFDLYTLGFPNEEVKYGFLKELRTVYMGDKSNLSEFLITRFLNDLQTGNIESFMIRLQANFAGISYEINRKYESYYQIVLYIFFKLLGQYVTVEERSASGRADIVVVTQNTVYVFELKISKKGAAEAALQQIDDKGYLQPYIASNKKLIKIGVEFSNTAKDKSIKKWLIEEVKN